MRWSFCRVIAAAIAIEYPAYGGHDGYQLCGVWLDQLIDIMAACPGIFDPSNATGVQAAACGHASRSETNAEEKDLGCRRGCLACPFFRITDERHLVPAYKHELVGNDLQSKEIGSDRPGRVFDSKGGGRHAAEPPTDPKRHAKFELAHEVGAILDAERKKDAYERLVIVAPPQFLGDLRMSMDDHVKQLVVAEVNKDLSKLSAQELESHLADELPRH